MAEGIAAVVDAVLGSKLTDGVQKKPSMGGFEEIFLDMQLAMGENFPQDMMFPFFQLPGMEVSQKDEEQGCMMAAEMLFSEFMPCDVKITDVSGELTGLNLELGKAVAENKSFESSPVQAVQFDMADNADGADDVKADSKNFMDMMETADNSKEISNPLHELKVSDETIKVLASLKKDKGESSLDISGEVLAEPQTVSGFETASKKLSAKFPSGEELANQVQHEMKKNIALGKKEFTVKIKPEGIGEIVVKLSEDKNFVTLKIFAASAETVKLITNEVASLQEALKPLNASVVQIENMEDKMVSQFSGNADMGNRNQFSNQNFFDRRHESSSRNIIFPTEEEEELSYVSVEDDGMDTYI